MISKICEESKLNVIWVQFVIFWLLGGENGKSFQITWKTNCRRIRVKDTSWTRKLQHCITQNQSLWLRSFSLANTAPTGFKAELKMNGSNVTYRSRQRFTLVNHHFSHLERFWPILDKIGLAGQILAANLSC